MRPFKLPVPERGEAAGVSEPVIRKLARVPDKENQRRAWAARWGATVSPR